SSTSNARTLNPIDSQRDGHKLKPNGSLLSRTLNTLTLCRVPDTRENLLARVRQGSRPVPHLRRPAIAPPIWATARGIFRRNATRHVECRKGYHTRHHAAGLLSSHREGGLQAHRCSTLNSFGTRGEHASLFRPWPAIARGASFGEIK